MYWGGGGGGEGVRACGVRAHIILRTRIVHRRDECAHLYVFASTPVPTKWDKIVNYYRRLAFWELITPTATQQ